jgi:hypothetical protein
VFVPRYCNILLAASLLATFAPSARAQETFYATLQGSTAIPPNSSVATGTATLVLDAAQTALSYEVVFTGIDVTGAQTPLDLGDDLVGAHIHASVGPGPSRPVVFGFLGAPFNDNLPNDQVVTPLPSGVGGTITGTWNEPEGNLTTLTAQLANIMAGRAYVDLHTVGFPGGEIAGPITQCLPLELSPVALPAGNQGSAYAQLITANGIDPEAFTLLSGTLPAGVTLAANGLLSGVPEVTGSFDFRVGVTDADSCIGDRSYQLVIGEPFIIAVPALGTGGMAMLVLVLFVVASLALRRLAG